MNTIQLAIIAVVVLLIIFTIGYYWYQEAKFKKEVENSFNHNVQDVIIQDKKIVFDKVYESKKDENKPIIPVDTYQEKTENIEQLDKIFNDNPLDEINILAEDSYPDDSVEAYFANVDKVTFPFVHDVSQTVDNVIDIAFEDFKKIKHLPDIEQYFAKSYKVFVLTKESTWVLYEKGNKYTAKALKYVLSLVDHNGVTNEIQLINVYNELHNFVLENEAHIRQTPYRDAIFDLQQKIKNIAKIKLELQLFLITKDKITYNELMGYFLANSFANEDGIFCYYEDMQKLFYIADENGNPLKIGQSYSLLSILADLHLVLDPHDAVEKIFNFAEKFISTFESRILTMNKQVMSEKDYDILEKHITNFVNTAKHLNIELGGTLLQRLYSTT